VSSDSLRYPSVNTRVQVASHVALADVIASLALLPMQCSTSAIALSFWRRAVTSSPIWGIAKSENLDVGRNHDRLY
jgi:hypothetical protein